MSGEDCSTRDRKSCECLEPRRRLRRDGWKSGVVLPGFPVEDSVAGVLDVLLVPVEPRAVAASSGVVALSDVSEQTERAEEAATATAAKPAAAGQLFQPGPGEDRLCPESAEHAERAEQGCSSGVGGRGGLGGRKVARFSGKRQQQEHGKQRLPGQQPLQQQQRTFKGSIKKRPGSGVGLCPGPTAPKAGGQHTAAGGPCDSVVVITGKHTLCVPDIYGIERNKMSSRWWTTASTEQHTQLAAQQLELGRIETTTVSPQNSPSLGEPGARRICANQKHRPGVSYDARTRKRQLYLHNFLERPRGWRAIVYHLLV